jgi:uncharacterized protein with NRDE domain
MCLAAIALDLAPRFRFVLAANRDEFYGRPTAPLDWWTPDAGAGAAGPRIQRAPKAHLRGWLGREPQILGGRDLRAGGTWLGLVRPGRLALVTNVREPAPIDPAAPSRGAIVPAWIAGDATFEDLALAVTGRGYAGVNVVAVDAPAGAAFYASNRAPSQRIEPGAVHAVSNAALDTPWPKVVRLKQRMAAAVGEGGMESTDELIRALFDALSDDGLAPDAELPTTGVPLALERQLSSAFIRTPDEAYGTRCSTVIVVDREALHVHERTFAIGASAASDRKQVLPLSEFPAWAMTRPQG